jgi:hypothetical protein
MILKGFFEVTAYRVHVAKSVVQRPSPRPIGGHRKV